MLNRNYSFEETDTRFCETNAAFSGVADEAVSFLIEKHFLLPDLWAKFVDQYRIRQDSDGGWRGEFWGKMMRGGVLLYQYRKDERLFAVLTDTVRDMLSAVGEDGRVSTYSVEKEFSNWDMWCRKYVLLGLEYYLEICRDSALEAQITEFLKNSADYIMEHIGAEEGKIKISQSSKHWQGINSSSILEAFVRLYRITSEKKYLDFATYIVEEGAAAGKNVFEAAYKNEVYPYQYGVPKAYELMSCFEGLIEYAKTTGNEKWKTAAVNFARGIIDSDVTVIGSCGITHELFDHSKARQTVTYEDVSQETCVTVTWMKLCSQLLRLTGDPIFADEMDRSLYNAYLGSMNEQGCVSEYMYNKHVRSGDLDHIVDTILPADSYSPLVPGMRGRKVGGNKVFSDFSYYGCCACIVGAGVGIYMKTILTEGREKDGTPLLSLNFLLNGKQSVVINDVKVDIAVKTGYPVSSEAKISVNPSAPIDFTLKLRVPVWAENTKISSACKHTVSGGFAYFKQSWNGENDIELSFDMPIKVTRPIEWQEDVFYFSNFYEGIVREEKVYSVEGERDYICLTKGPIVLAADSSLGKPADSPFDIEIDGDTVNATPIEDSKLNCMLMYSVKDKKDGDVALIDYASAGKDWNTVISAGLPTK